MPSKFGRRIRRLANKADAQRKASYECPKCNKLKVKRKGYARWACKSCKAQFAGGAYSFTTPFGRTTKRLLKDLSKK